jgi:hypothetical protein
MIASYFSMKKCAISARDKYYFKNLLSAIYFESLFLHQQGACGLHLS